uniref:Uncharacterized protein n=1 Tax=Anguilla anguilla TaxID=7936 RepID=A0A0E9WEU1_ANGAN
MNANLEISKFNSVVAKSRLKQIVKNKTSSPEAGESVTTVQVQAEC